MCFYIPKMAILFYVFLMLGSCTKQQERPPEPWISQPVSAWPDFALTNEISFADTTFKNLANAFLIDTGYDTLGVSCKHLFMVFENQLDLQFIDLGKDFRYWRLYPKNDPAKVVFTQRLINQNPNESIGEFNTLKVRDWIIFEVQKNLPDIYPLKIRYAPIKEGEIVYAVGWGCHQTDTVTPARVKLQCLMGLGNYYYVRSLKTDAQPQGRSGSPVIDQKGYLVGIVSGAEGNMGVIGSVGYLRKLFEDYGIKY